MKPGWSLPRAVFSLQIRTSVVTSALIRVEEIKQGLEIGVDDYLLKPFNPIQLRARALVALRWLGYLGSLVEDQRAGS